MANPRRSPVVKAPLSSSAVSQAVLTFDERRTIAGVVFHLIEEKHADRVSEASIRHTHERLLKKGLHLSIAREHWEAMSNCERLEWLLARSRTHAIYSGRTAILAANS